MTRRSAWLALALVALLAGGCTSDVVDGRVVARQGSSSGTVVQFAARFDDPAAVARVQRDVRAGVEAVNTYDYRSLDAARINALRYSTGEYRVEYERTFRTVVSKNAPSLRAEQRARVTDVGVSSLADGTAYLLVFGQLEVRTGNAPQGRKDPFALVVRATKVSGRWLLSQVKVGAGSVNTATGTPGLEAAERGAQGVARALTTLTRQTFDADYARALALVTGSVRADVRRARAATLKALQDGGFDLSGDALADGTESAIGSRAVVLVSVYGYKVRNGKREDEATMQRLRIGMVSIGNQWLAEKIDSIGVS